MGFIRAALSAGLNSFNDSKFKEAVVLPDHISSDVMASRDNCLQKILTVVQDKATKILVF